MGEVPHPRFFRLPTPTDLRAMRRACGMTQLEVGEELGVNGAQVAHWEHADTRPLLSNLERLLAVYTLNWPTDGGSECAEREK